MLKFVILHYEPVHFLGDNFTFENSSRKDRKWEAVREFTNNKFLNNIGNCKLLQSVRLFKN